MAAKILTRRQLGLLREFFSHERTPPSFYLTGGTALAAFYLRHRLSDDLDIFTIVEGDLEPGGRALEDVAKKLGILLTREERSEDTWIYHVEDPEETGRPLRKIDLIRDAPPTFGEPQWKRGARVDTLENMVVGKITALGRQDPKDFVDLFFIESVGRLRVLDFLDRAKAKDPGFDELQFAADLKWLEAFEIDKLTRFLAEYQIKPITAPELLQFSADLSALVIGLFR